MTQETENKKAPFIPTSEQDSHLNVLYSAVVNIQNEEDAFVTLREYLESSDIKINSNLEKAVK